ncbi:MAG: hypothetical protein KDI38_08320 [Calditrichaeota bacterium]|nr:hypothetical protein [Calditrichota bacterium]MCB0303769.1 hypothetical protein [Calditrichota bacterium]
MPAEKFALETGGDERLELRWQFGWRNMRVTLDGVPVGEILTRKALREGRTVPLPDGSELYLQLDNKWLGADLLIYRDGQPLPGSVIDPRILLGNVYIVLFFIAVLFFLLGAGAVLLQIDLFREWGMGMWAVHYSLIFFVLSVGVKKRSALALSLTVFLFLADGGLEVYYAAKYQLAPPVLGIFFRVILIIWVSQGFGAIRELQRMES